MIFETLHESSERGELLLVDGGLCHWHHRRDGQVTIREIISQKPGAGQRMLRRLEATIGATSLFAKCPANLPANEWYSKRGFHVERMEVTPSGRKLLCWRKNLKRVPRPNLPGGVELIYSSGGNRRFAEIALDAGWLVGSQLPESVYYQPYFADQDWKQPDRETYMKQLAKHTPYMATVLDWECDNQFGEVMAWAEEAAQHVQVVIIIPKVDGGVHRIPETVNGKRVRLGYSVPTKFGGTTVPVAEFGGRPVHLLGGSPDEQMRLTKFMNVRSVDTNYHQKQATGQSVQFYAAQNMKAKNWRWPTLQEAGIACEYDAPAKAFELSCKNIMKAWRVFLAVDRVRQDMPAQLPLNFAVA